MELSAELSGDFVEKYRLDSQALLDPQRVGDTQEAAALGIIEPREDVEGSGRVADSRRSEPEYAGHLGGSVSSRADMRQSQRHAEAERRERQIAGPPSQHAIQSERTRVAAVGRRVYRCQR
jgi:hypothetical protein